MSTIDLERLMKYQNFTIEELKYIANSAVKELASKENVKVDFRPMTAKDYYESDFFNEQMKLAKGYKKIDLFFAPYKKWAFCYKNTIVIFVDRFNNEDRHNKNHQLVDVLFSSFHELAHIIQKEKTDDFSDYQNFIFCMESVLIKDNYFHYVKFFDKYYTEAFADLYAIYKTEEFLSKYSMQLNKSRNYINKLKDDKQLTFNTYDFSFIFSRLHKLRGREMFSKFQNPIGSNIYEKNSDIFLDVLRIRKVLENSEDKRVFYSIISSESFLSQLDFSSLIEEEIDILIEAVNFTYFYECQKRIDVKKYYNKYDNLNIFCPEILVGINYRITKLEEIILLLKQYKNRFSLMKIKKKPSPCKSK